MLYNLVGVGVCVLWDVGDSIAVKKCQGPTKSMNVMSVFFLYLALVDPLHTEKCSSS